MLNKLILIMFVMLLGMSDGWARIQINLDAPDASPLPIAVPDFHAVRNSDTQLAADIAKVVRQNFHHSAMFNMLDQQAYLQDPETLAIAGPMYQDWRLINADAVIGATVRQVVQGGAEKVQVDFRLFDVQAEKVIIGRRYTIDRNFWRHAAHKISDDIYSELTGEPGYFASRIVHIAENKGPDGQIQKRLCVMDQDGANYKCLTNGDHLVLTPRFNRQLQKVIYMSYASGKPRLYLLDLPTGQQEIVGDFEGLNSSPRFHPNGERVAMTLTKGHEGNPEIYTMDLNTRTLQRLTNFRGIDTSPDYSPDGQQIVFNSTRAGKPALYIMNADGTETRRLTYGKGQYFAPTWSPRGDLIAFVKLLNGTFHIGVIDPQGNEERLLTDAFMDESPTWSPNGRVLAFARQTHDGRTRIYSIDLTGYNLRELPTPQDASDPAWSPVVQ